MKFSELLRVQEGDMKYQVLAIAKEVHTRLAELSFIEMLSIMNEDNPAKVEVQDLETKLNQLTTEVGFFIQKHIPNVTMDNPEETSVKKAQK